MNTRAMRCAVPVVAVALLLSGCGLTAARDAGKAELTVPKASTEVCNLPSYISEQAPEGLCGTKADTKADDDLSNGWYHRHRTYPWAD